MNSLSDYYIYYRTAPIISHKIIWYDPTLSNIIKFIKNTIVISKVAASTSGGYRQRETLWRKKAAKY